MTAPRSRAEQKRHTRALIVDAGRRTVASRGFSGLVVRELAREAGIVPTAFYRHFDSVEELATELAGAAADALSEFIDSLVSTPTQDPASDWPLQASARAAENPQTWSVLARGLVDTAGPDHRVLSAAVDTARRRLGITLGRLESLSGADEAVVDVTADLVVVVLVRHLMDVAAGQDARTPDGDCAARLRVVLAGAAAQ
ncbi:TetR family transcriptional regulator [Dietzia aurantiaca]|uniref:TetR/AcrR family transcriptional regulator n=1 Tax=Dietzia aurantiaca TaxID=983873 RepID=UPI001E2EC558|nr:TetR/AcrR family transcriptional regulator [Dietzia aurantiaca]MCD2263123.1 TetR family transcriptional regulator [Dietzia aurantiaca]